MADRIQLRRGTHAEWALANPILSQGEMGLTLDEPIILKIGDAVLDWNNLPIWMSISNVTWGNIFGDINTQADLLALIGSHGLQDALIADSVLTQNNTIDCSGYQLTFNNLLSLNVSADALVSYNAANTVSGLMIDYYGGDIVARLGGSGLTFLQTQESIGTVLGYVGGTEFLNATSLGTIIKGDGQSGGGILQVKDVNDYRFLYTDNIGHVYSFGDCDSSFNGTSIFINDNDSKIIIAAQNGTILGGYGQGLIIPYPGLPPTYLLAVDANGFILETAIGGGGAATLTENQIGFGDASNLMTSSVDLSYDGAKLTLNGGLIAWSSTYKAFSIGDIYTAASNTGEHVFSFGEYAAQNNTGWNTNAFGNSAGQDNSGDNVNVFGQTAGNQNTGDHLNAFGLQAGQNNTGLVVNAFGMWAGKSNSGSNVNAMGYQAGEQNTGSGLNAFGEGAGYLNSGTNVTAIGYFAGYGNTNNDVVLLGENATATGDKQMVFAHSMGSAVIDFSAITGQRNLNVRNLEGDILVADGSSSTAGYVLTDADGTGYAQWQPAPTPTGGGTGTALTSGGWTNQMVDSTSGASLDWDQRLLWDSSVNPSIDYENRLLRNSSYGIILNWETGELTGMPVNVLADFNTSVGNSGTTETDLFSYTLPASKLGGVAASGKKASLSYGGTFLGHATATRRIRFYFGVDKIFDTNAVIITATCAWTLEIQLMAKTANNIMRYSAKLITPQGSFTSNGELAGTNTDAAQNLRLTGTAASTGAASNDIIATIGHIIYIRPV